MSPEKAVRVANTRACHGSLETSFLRLNEARPGTHLAVFRVPRLARREGHSVASSNLLPF
jgi:hypothetical protein